MGTLMIDSNATIIKMAWLRVMNSLGAGDNKEKLRYEVAIYDFILGHIDCELLARQYIDLRHKMLKDGITDKRRVIERLGWKIPFTAA